MSTASAPQAEEIGRAYAIYPVAEEVAAAGTSRASETWEIVPADTRNLVGEAPSGPPSSAAQAEKVIEAFLQSLAEEQTEVKAEEEWYKTLYEEDSKRLLELLKEREDLQLWKRGWKEERSRLVKGRPRNYWEKETESPWKGRTALHVGARRGNVKLLDHVLRLCKKEEETDRRGSIMENLFSTKDGEYELDAVAIAIVNGNKDVVRTLLEPGLHHPPLKKLYCIEKEKMKDEKKENKGGAPTMAEKIRKIREIMREIKESFQVDPQFQAAVLDRYELHRDFNFCILEENPEYLFHFLFTRFQAVEDGSLDFYLASKINVLILAEIATKINALVEIASKINVQIERGDKPESERGVKATDIWISLWAMQDWQGRPPLHIAADEECSEIVLLEKKEVLTRETLSVFSSVPTIGSIIQALDGAGRTAVHRTFVRGDKMPLKILLHNSERGDDRELYNRSHILGNGPLANLTKPKSRSTANGFEDLGERLNSFQERQRVLDEHERQRVLDERQRVADLAFQYCLAIPEFDVERRSGWTSRAGDKYHIDLGHLSERNGFCGQFLPECRPIVSALLHYYDFNDDLLQLFDFFPTGFSRVVGEYDPQGPAFLDTLHLTDADIQLPSSQINVVQQILRLQMWYQITKKRDFTSFITDPDPWQGDIKYLIAIAAAMGNYDMLYSLIDTGHDPLKEFTNGNTLLHYAMKGVDNQTNRLPFGIHMCSFVNCEHMLKTSKKSRERWASNLHSFITREKALADKVLVERQGCISLLIQQGCDIIKTNQSGEVPHLHRNTSPKLLKWWYEKQLKEFQRAQSEYSLATNAISVTAALVATASYVGPLQPPLGYNDSPTQLRLDITAVKVFVVCDTLSFYLAIAAIIYALVPCLPLHSKQSITDNLRHTRMMVMTAVGLLFPSIICILVAFAAGSIAVIQTNQAESTNGGVAFNTTFVGGLACLSAIVIFSRRLLAVISTRNRLS